MGQAKRRGTYEERVAQAVERNAKLESNIKAQGKVVHPNIQQLATRLINAQLLDVMLIPPPQNNNNNNNNNNENSK